MARRKLIRPGGGQFQKESGNHSEPPAPSNF
nr:MAG TPA: hypothetical protein [Caudoviricetes sp.]